MRKHPTTNERTNDNKSRGGGSGGTAAPAFSPEAHPARVLQEFAQQPTLAHKTGGSMRGFIHDMLKFNVGSGYYSYEGFEEGPTLLSDASKSRAYTGGGYVESTGFYDFWQ